MARVADGPPRPAASVRALRGGHGQHGQGTVRASGGGGKELLRAAFRHFLVGKPARPPAHGKAAQGAGRGIRGGPVKRGGATVRIAPQSRRDRPGTTGEFSLRTTGRRDDRTTRNRASPANGLRGRSCYCPASEARNRPRREHGVLSSRHPVVLEGRARKGCTFIELGPRQRGSPECCCGSPGRSSYGRQNDSCGHR